MIRMLATILIACTAIGAYPHEARAAFIDRAAYGDSARYLDLGSVPEERRDEAVTAMQFWLPHLSRGVVIDHQRGVRLPGTSLYRIDLDLLGWGWKAWVALAQEYPYELVHDGHGGLRRSYNPVIIRGDWLLRVTADANEFRAYETLLYAGTTTPKTKADFLKVFGVRLDDTSDIDAGTIVDRGMSGVALNTRLIRWAPTARGHFFETFDSASGAGKADPLENLSPGTRFDPARHSFDAQEFIVSMPKLDLATGRRGIVQAYALADGRGNIVRIAEGTIVTDHQRLFGISQIRTPGSCVQCHGALNGPRENLLRSLISEGVELTAKDKRSQEFLDRFYLSELGQIVGTGNEQFAAFVESACGEGVAPGDAIADWKRTVESYDAAVTLDQAALELASEPGELRNAIAYYSDHLGPTPAIGRLAALAHGRAVDRDSWEQSVYPLSVKALKLWRSK